MFRENDDSCNTVVAELDNAATSTEFAPPLLRMKNVTVWKGNSYPIRNLSLEIPQGRHTVIYGPNGSGKSSLIKLIMRDYYPVFQSDPPPVLEIFGMSEWNVFELRSDLGIVTADMDRYFLQWSAGITGLEAVLSGFFSSVGLSLHQPITSEMKERAINSLRWMEVEHLAQKRLDHVSTGEIRRILISRALVHDPRALLLDEPTTGLDIVSAKYFTNAIRRIAALGKTIILVTHHLEEIIPEISYAVLLREGSLFLEGPKEEIFTSANFTSLFRTPVVVTKRGDYYTAYSEQSR
jgi:iron complex transport system ATP-binding protein